MLRYQGVSAVLSGLLVGALWLLGGVAHADHIFSTSAGACANSSGDWHDYSVLRIPVSTGERQLVKNLDGSGDFQKISGKGISFHQCARGRVNLTRVRVCDATSARTESWSEGSSGNNLICKHDGFRDNYPDDNNEEDYIPPIADRGRYVHSIHAIGGAIGSGILPSPVTRIFHAELELHNNALRVATGLAADGKHKFIGPRQTVNAKLQHVQTSVPDRASYLWHKCKNNVQNSAGGCDESVALTGARRDWATIDLANLPDGVSVGEWAQVLIRYAVTGVSYSGYGYNSADAGAGRVMSMPFQVPPAAPNAFNIHNQNVPRNNLNYAAKDDVLDFGGGTFGTPSGHTAEIQWQARTTADWVLIGTNPTYSITTFDVRYSRQIRARVRFRHNASGLYSAYTTSSNIFRAVAPGPVETFNNSVTVDGSTISLSWTRLSIVNPVFDSVTHFYIYRSTNPEVDTSGTTNRVRRDARDSVCRDSQGNGSLNCRVSFTDQTAGTRYYYRIVPVNENPNPVARGDTSATLAAVWYQPLTIAAVTSLLTFNVGITQTQRLPLATGGATRGSRQYTLSLDQALPAGLSVKIITVHGIESDVAGTQGRNFQTSVPAGDLANFLITGMATSATATDINATYKAEDMDPEPNLTSTTRTFSIRVVNDNPGQVSLSRTENVTFNQAITATLTDGDGKMSEFYEWQHCTIAWHRGDAADPVCTAIANTNSASYTVSIGDANEGRHIRVKIDYNDTNADRTAYSNTVPLQLAAELSAITINKGGLQRSANYAGDILTAGEISVTDSALSAAINFGADSYAYAWQRSATETTGFADITNATAATYAITADDVGYLRVRVTRTSTNAGPIVRTSSAILVRSTGALRLIPVPNQTYVLGQTIEVLNLGADMGGGGPAADKTYTLSESDGTLAELGLEAAAGNPLRPISGNTSTTPIRIRSIAGETTRTGNVRLTYRVTEAVSGATPAEYSFSITVLSATVTDGELADTAVPEIINAINATIATNIGARVRAVRNGEADKSKLQLDGADDWDSFIFQNAHAEIHGGQDWKKVFGNSRFSFTYPSENDLELPLNGYWGQGNYQTLSGEKDGIKWDGSLLGLSIGTDTRLETGNLFGVAFNRQSGSFDVTKSGRSGGYDLSLNTVSPYVSGEFMDYEYHASVHIGRGKFGAHSLKNLGASAGSSRHFRDNRFGAQHLKGDFIFSGAKVGGANVDTGRLRVLLEQHKAQTLPNGWELHLTGDIGGRLDLGAGGGLGVEAVGQARYIRGLITTYGQLRTLLFHSDDVREFGLQVRVQVAPGQDGQGLSLQLTPSYGEAESGLSDLWEHGVSQAGISNSTAPNRSDYIWQMDARLGFGLRLKDAGLLTPYASTRYGDAPRFGLGLNWKPRMQDLELDLSGEQSDSQQRVLLKGTLGF